MEKELLFCRDSYTDAALWCVGNNVAFFDVHLPMWDREPSMLLHPILIKMLIKPSLSHADNFDRIKKEENRPTSKGIFMRCRFL